MIGSTPAVDLSIQGAGAALEVLARLGDGREFHRVLDRFVAILAEEADNRNVAALCALATLAMESDNDYEIEAAPRKEFERFPRRSAWFILAAAQSGFAPAQFEVGWWFETDKLPPLCSKESPDEAWARWADRSLHDKLVEAMEWYRKAAAQGHISARLQFAHLILDGRAKADPYFAGEIPQAIEWLQDVADKGDADAQFDLATMVEAGTIDSFNGRSVRHYYGSAAKLGHPGAKARLGRILESNGDLAGALELYQAALSAPPSAGWSEDAEYYAGRLLLNDEDLGDTSEGLRLLKSAARYGDKRAQSELDKYFSVFHLSSSDEYAISIATSVARRLLSAPGLTAEQADGLRGAVLALNRMPAVTPGVSYTFGIAYSAGDAEFRESRYIDFEISESHFCISQGGAQYDRSIGSDSISEPSYRIEINGYCERDCDLGNIEDRVGEYLTLGAEIRITVE